MTKPQLPPQGKKPMQVGNSTKPTAVPAMKKIVTRVKKP